MAPSATTTATASSPGGSCREEHHRALVGSSSNANVNQAVNNNNNANNSGANNNATAATAVPVDHREADLRFLRSKSKEVSFSHLEGTKYSALATIGSGAYGVVCAALDKKTKEKVAIKKIPNAMEMSVIAKRTFREIKILRHFKHENIVGIKDILLSREERGTGNATGTTTTTTTTTTQTNSLKDIYVVLDFMESDLHHIIHSKQVWFDIVKRCLKFT